MKSVAFLLTPEFAPLAYSSVIVPFHYVNYALGKTAYELSVCTFDGEPVADTMGVRYTPHFAARALPRPPNFIILCTGRNIERYESKALLRWLREMARGGAYMGAVSTGAHMLAAAGLLDGYRATIHWQNQASFAETFPRVALTDAIFEIDRNRMTCSGGNAAMDMALQIIAKDHGTDMALRCAKEFLHDRIRSAEDLQHSSRLIALRNQSQALAEAVSVVDQAPPTEISLDTMIDAAGVSLRQLQRLFRERMQTTPKRYLAEAKLLFARRLLLQSNLKIMEIAAAANFSSQSYFCQRYAKHFGLSPSEERKRHR